VYDALMTSGKAMTVAQIRNAIPDTADAHRWHPAKPTQKNLRTMLNSIENHGYITTDDRKLWSLASAEQFKAARQAEVEYRESKKDSESKPALRYMPGRREPVPVKERADATGSIQQELRLTLGFGYMLGLLTGILAGGILLLMS